MHAKTPANRAGRTTTEVFAQNLRQLVAAEKSVSAVCRALDINRTQFNRYLSGEAHPRPEVLERICDHFNRDARILLTPLAELDAWRTHRLPAEIDPAPLMAQVQGFDHNRLPDGLYRVLMPSFNSPDIVLASLIRLFTLENGGKGVNWDVPLYAARLTGKPVGWRDRKQTGICLQQSDGASMLMASHYTRLFLLYFVSSGYRGLPNVNVGYAALTQDRHIDQEPLQPLIMERIEGGIRAALAHRRNMPFVARTDLTELQRHYFETWKPGWASR